MPGKGKHMPSNLDAVRPTPGARWPLSARAVAVADARRAAAHRVAHAKSTGDAEGVVPVPGPAR
jgi:hypothetical protein